MDGVLVDAVDPEPVQGLAEGPRHGGAPRINAECQTARSTPLADVGEVELGTKLDNAAPHARVIRAMGVDLKRESIIVQGTSKLDRNSRRAVMIVTARRWP